MKQTITILLSFLTTLTFAQKVNIKDNVAYVDDSSFCKIIGKQTLVNPEYSIAALDGTELIYVNENPDKDYVTLTFLATNKKAKLPTEKTGMFNKKIFIKMLFKNNVIVGNEINEIGKNKFLAKYASEEDETVTTANTSDNKITLVDRDTEAEITVEGTKIMQDGKTIGMLVLKNYSDDNANMMRKYSFVLPNKTNIAEININEFYAEKNTFITIKDNKIHNLKTSNGSFNTQEDDVLLNAVKYLVKFKYL
jgi:hypothetical protein